MRDKTLIFGASSGIGKALALQLQTQGTPTVLLSRTPEKLQTSACYRIEGDTPASVETALKQAYEDHPDISHIILVAGCGEIETGWDTSIALDTIRLNCETFTRACYASAHFLESRGQGHLLAISSVSALRGGSRSLTYSASKAYQSTLLEGIACRFAQSGKPLYLTEVRPGFVDTSMMKTDKPFWVCSPEKAALQILKAVKNRPKLIYVSRRWRLIAIIMKLIPSFLYLRIG